MVDHLEGITIGSVPSPHEARLLKCYFVCNGLSRVGRNICNPHILPGPYCIKLYAKNPVTNWDGSMQMYEALSPFLFGKAVSNQEIAHSSTSQAFSRLVNNNHGRQDAVFQFLTSVHARTIVDMAKSHLEDFVRQWCATDKDSYEPWDTLDEYCLAREDLNFMYADFVSPILDPVGACEREVTKAACNEVVSHLVAMEWGRWEGLLANSDQETS